MVVSLRNVQGNLGWLLTPPRALAFSEKFLGTGWKAIEPRTLVTSSTLSVTLNQWS